MDLLSNIKTGAGGILNILERLNGAFMPSGAPISDPALEEAAGPEATARARELYQRQYNTQRAQAIENGANVFNMDALASQGAQDSYSQNLARSVQAVDMLRERRTKTGRLDALQQLIAGIADPQQRALALANPEGFADAAIKDQFRPDTEKFTYMVNSDGTVFRGDKETGQSEWIRDPQAAAAIRDKLANVTETNDGRVLAFGQSGKLLNEIEGGVDPKATAAEAKALKTQQEARRREFNALAEVKNYKAVLPILEDAKQAPDTAAGDITWIYTIGKILDPESVIRDSEMSLAIKSGSLMERILGTTRFELDGKGRLSPEVRARLEMAMQGRVDMLRRPYLQARETYSGYATEDGFDPTRVVGQDPLAAFDKRPPLLQGDAAPPASNNGWSVQLLPGQ